MRQPVIRGWENKVTRVIDQNNSEYGLLPGNAVTLWNGLRKRCYFALSTKVWKEWNGNFVSLDK